MISDKLIAKLKTKKVIVYCAGYLGEYTCALLIEFGIDIICLCDNSHEKKGKKILGIPVLSYDLCKQRYDDCAFIISHKDYYKAELISKELQKDGYKHNITYFIYQEIKWNIKDIIPFHKILSNKKIVLQGSEFLCKKMFCWLNESIQIQNSIIVTQYDENKESSTICDSEATWIFLDKPCISSPLRNITSVLQKHKIVDMSLYFMTNYIYCNSDNKTLFTPDVCDETNNVENMINTVVFLVDSGCSGSFLIQSLLDSHPNILYLGWNRFSFDIWRYVTLAKDQSQVNIIPYIREQLQKDYSQMHENMPIELESIIFHKSFQEKFDVYTKNKTKLTERELLISLYLAYYATLNKKEYNSETKPIIYIDMHTDYKQVQEVGLRWIYDMGFHTILLKMIRNPIIRLGSYFKFQTSQVQYLSPVNVYEWFQRCGEELKFENEKNVANCKIRFEDLKLYPQEVLQRICEIFQIPWSDTLLETTEGNKQAVYNYTKEHITGFDLKPVYYQYEEYFSSFDKFRLDILFAIKEEAYGYSYFDNAVYDFSHGQILKFFKYPFRFEKYMKFKTEEEKQMFRDNLYLTCKFMMYRVWNQIDYEDAFYFSQYVKITS